MIYIALRYQSPSAVALPAKHSETCIQIVHQLVSSRHFNQLECPLRAHTDDHGVWQSTSALCFLHRLHLKAHGVTCDDPLELESF